MRNLFYMLLVICVISSNDVHARKSHALNDTVLQKVFHFQENHHYKVDGIETNIYSRYLLKSVKRNALLLTVPSMYVLFRSNRIEYGDFAGEIYSKVKVKDVSHLEELKQINVSTAPRQKLIMPYVHHFMTLDIYGITLLNGNMLSPFNEKNAILYRYSVTPLTDGRSEVIFRPKKYNTQMVAGKAIVNSETGHIMKVELEGEYDMIRFKVVSDMGDEGPYALLPQDCKMESTFKYLGNVIEGSYQTFFNMPDVLPDTIKEEHDWDMMEELRPEPLPDYEKRLYEQYDSLHPRVVVTEEPKVEKKKKNWAKIIFWDAIGDNLLNRIKGNFGNNSQGSFKISPIFNPLYMDYSASRGITYKMKIRSNYNFSSNSELSMTARLGYHFKLHQFYFRIPIVFEYNKKKNAYVLLDIGNGNRIHNNSIRDQLVQEYSDSIDWQSKPLDYFNDTYVKIRSNHDLSEHWSIGLGATYHKRSAIHKEVFKELGLPYRYSSLAPNIDVKYRPMGYNGPVFTFDYERGITGVGEGEMNYGRVELDASWLLKFQRLRSLSMRMGYGFYTHKNKGSYFLDYENFHMSNLTGGWNDDWSGDFQLLGGDQYNNSWYYFRTNLTYESPLLLISRFPLVGKIIEMERFYMSTLFVDKLTPYTEWGYGFTNRIFSLGIFVSTNKFKYDGFGCRIGFELFSDW